MGARSTRDECRDNTQALVVMSITPTAELPRDPLFVAYPTILTLSYVPSEEEQEHIINYLDNSYYARAGGKK